MKTNNQHLKKIANNLGSEVMPNKTDNYYLKRIEENTRTGLGEGVSYDTLEVEITYEDDSTDVVELYIVPNSVGE